MTRKEGFIEVDKMLQEIGVNTVNINNITDDSRIDIKYFSETYFHFSFSYHNETYFYKYSNSNYVNPYNELVAEELAKDFDILCASYDLAILKSYKGVLSRSFEKQNTQYINGDDLFNQYIYETKNPAFNNIEDIWDVLEYYCHDYINKKEIVQRLMGRIIDIYFFDILVCNCDRHCQNWKIMKWDNGIDIAPLYDNERILADYEEDNSGSVSMGMNLDYCNNWENLLESLKHFQKVSSSEFTNIIKEKLWIISEENLYRVFERIERKTGYPIPQERKSFYLNSYKNHKKRLEEILDLTVEREEPNERKNQ